MEKVNLTKLRKEANVSYIGGCRHSHKAELSYENGTMTYFIYLMPSDGAGKKYNTCPNAKYCKAFCLANSGQAKIAILAKGMNNIIVNARINKTKLFFDKKDLFMEIVIEEIKRAMESAKKKGMEFAIRLNGTSDISPEDFTYKGRNLLEMFPNVQFYDYTKVYERIELLQKYPNYDLTLSFNGHNWNECKNFLNKGGKVAVVFDGKMPTTFNGYNVIDANGYDMRFKDPKSTIMGLTYHRVANDYRSGKYKQPKSKFIVRTED